MSRAKNNPGIPRWKGSTLRIRRQWLGWTMKELAESVGVSKTTVFRWENDEHAPTSEELARLSHQLDVTPATFAKEARIV